MCCVTFLGSSFVRDILQKEVFRLPCVLSALAFPKYFAFFHCLLVKSPHLQKSKEAFLNGSYFITARKRQEATTISLSSKVLLRSDHILDHDG